MASVSFNHPYVGTLTIDTGVDNAAWAYGLNTATFPTYGGEVIQILSVYIDDLTLTGTVATYQQLELIYDYFTTYFQAATQGKNPTPQPGESSYDLHPMYFSYPARNWNFKVYPTGAPGFRYGLEVVAPQWQVVCHVIDDSPDLSLIKDGIMGAAVTNLNAALPAGANINDVSGQSQTLNISGEISPQYGNPNTDPFQTYDSGLAAQQQDISKYADYYNSLIPSYMKGDFSAVTGAVGSQPNFGARSNQPKGSTAKLPKGKGK